MAEYQIAQGDTLGAIAKKYGTTVQALAAQNNISNPNLIKAGSRIQVPSIGGTVNNTQIQPQVPLNVPTPPPTGADAFATSFNQANEAVTGAQGAVDTAQAGVQSSQNDILGLLQQLEGKSAEQIQLENQAGIPQVNEELMGLQNEAKRLSTEYTNAIRAREAQGGVAAIVGADQKRIQSQAAADIGLLNAQIQAKQGQIELAQNTVDRAIKIKYEPLLQRIETKKQIYEMNRDNLSRADKALLDAKDKQWTLEKTKLEKQMNDEKSIQNMIIDGQAQGAPANIINAAKNAKTPVEAAQILGKYSGDAAKAELLREQIKTEKAQRANINANMDKTRAEIAALGTPGSGKPPTPDQVTNAGFADRIAQANSIIDSKADTFKKMSYATFKLASSDSILANRALSADQRQAAQAMRNFLIAKLRKESGAAISASEYNQNIPLYFPIPGDDPQTLINKKALRDSVLNNLIAGSGSAYKPSIEDSYVNSVVNSIGNVNNGTNIPIGSYIQSILNQ